jgi:hypothetical protein
MEMWCASAMAANRERVPKNAFHHIGDGVIIRVRNARYIYSYMAIKWNEADIARTAAALQPRETAYLKQAPKN